MTTERVITVSAGVADTIGFSTGLDPDEGIDERIACGRGRSDTEASTVDVAPVTPLETEALDSIAASVDDGVVGHACGLEGRSECCDVALLVLALVVLGIRGFFEFSRVHGPGVPSCNVGSDTEDLFGASGSLVGAGEHLGTRL